MIQLAQWLGLAFLIVAYILNIYQNKLCWFLFGICNVLNGYACWRTGNWGLVTQYVIMTGFNVWGYLVWKRRQTHSVSNMDIKT